MAASYIDATYIASFITDDVRVALFDDDEDGSLSAGETSNQDQLIQTASEQLKGYAKTANHLLGDTTTNELVKMGTLGLFLLSAYGRRQETMPEQFHTHLMVAQQIKDGELELSTDPSAPNAIGGVDFSETSTSLTNGRFQVFSRGALKVY